MISKQHIQKTNQNAKMQMIGRFFTFLSITMPMSFSKSVKIWKENFSCCNHWQKAKKVTNWPYFLLLIHHFQDSLWIVSSVGKAKKIKSFKKAGGFKLKFEIGGLWPRPRKANIHGSERKKCPRWKGKKKFREIAINCRKLLFSFLRKYYSSLSNCRVLSNKSM